MYLKIELGKIKVFSNDTKFVYTGQSARYYRVGIRYNFGKSFTIEQSKSSSEKGRL